MQIIKYTKRYNQLEHEESYSNTMFNNNILRGVPERGQRGRHIGWGAIFATEQK